MSGPGLLKAMLKFFATTTDTEAGNCKVALETKLWSGSIPNDQQGSVSGKDNPHSFLGSTVFERYGCLCACM